MGINSSDEVEGLKFDDSFEEDEEEGGEGSVPPTTMLCRGVFDSWKNESRSSLRVDGSLDELLCSSMFWSPESWLS